MTHVRIIYIEGKAYTFKQLVELTGITKGKFNYWWNEGFIDMMKPMIIERMKTKGKENDKKTFDKR